MQMIPQETYVQDEIHPNIKTIKKVLTFELGLLTSFGTDKSNFLTVATQTLDNFLIGFIFN